MPLAPASPFDQAFYDSIGVPTLIVGGTIDGTTPFETQQRAPFEAMSTGGAFVGLAEIVEGGHFTFSDFCEVDRTLLGFLGGFSEACEPRHLPWRHARDRVNYLALNFFDAFLRGDADALGRLDAAVVNAFDDVVLETK
jgi:predicted dienelactone hydrolase